MSLQIWLPLVGSVKNQGLSNATITSTLSTYGTSPLGSSATFSSNYILINGTPIVTGVDKFSFAFWHYTSSNATQCFYNGRTSVGTAIGIFNISGKFRVDDGAQHSFTYSIPTDSKWHHYVITRDSSNIKLYVDGVLNQTVASSAFTCTVTYASIGMSSVNTASPSGNPLVGGLCDYRIYDHCLSVKEVKELSKGLSIHLPLKGLPANPNLYPNSTTLVKSGSGGTFTISYGNTEADGVYTRMTCTATGYGPWFSAFNAKRYTGTKLTWSCYARASKSTTKLIGHESGGRANFALTTDWKKISYTWTASGGGAFTVYNDWAVNDWVDIKDLKIEEGSQATPWVPNIYDTAYSSLGYGTLSLPYTLTGSPTNSTGNISGFATTKYINTNTKVAWNGASKWDIYLKFTTGSDVSTAQYISSQQTSTNGDSITLSISSGYFRIILGTGSSWSILTTDTNTFAVSTSTTYYVKISFTGSAYTVSHSTTSFSAVTQDYSLTSSTKIATDTANRILGNNRTTAYPFLGSIDMDAFAIYLNGNPVYLGKPSIGEKALVVDCTGYGRAVTASGKFYPVSDGPRGTATDFLFSSSYLSTSSSGAIGNNFTISWWSKTSDMAGRMAWGFKDGNRLNLYPSGGYFYCNTGDSANNPFKNNGSNVPYAAYQDGNWHHYCVTGNGTTNTLYIDGVSKGTSTTFKGITGSQIIVSGWDTSTDYKWIGSLSDCRVYGTCLSADDVKALYSTPISIDKTGKLYCREIVEE